MKTILLVEPDLLAAKEGTRQLEYEGHGVVHARNGAEAMGILLAGIGRFDRILVGGPGSEGNLAVEALTWNLDWKCAGFDDPAVLIAIMDLSGNVILANRPYEKLNWSSFYRYTSAQTSNQFPMDIARKHHIKEPARLESGREVESEAFNGNADGLWHSYLTTRVPICDWHMKTSGVMTVSVDVTAASPSGKTQRRSDDDCRSLFGEQSDHPVVVDGSDWPTLDFAAM
jgi:CheY-like chemotaxis protein